MTLSINDTQQNTTQHNDNKHNYTQQSTKNVTLKTTFNAEFLYAEYGYTECRYTDYYNQYLSCVNCVHKPKLQRWVSWAFKSHLSSTTKCDSSHTSDNYELGHT
jgi:hypothetical protein